MIYLYGAGGHAKVISDIFKINTPDEIGIIDDNTEVNAFLGKKVQHAIPVSFNSSTDNFFISIGNNEIRKRIAVKLGNVPYATAIHSRSDISDSVLIEKGTAIMGNTLINADTKIGKHCIINSSASVDHDCIIHDFVHIAPGAILCGGVIVGEGSQISAGATVIQGITIGKNVVIGAGAVVIRDIPDNAIAVGNPAKVIRHI